MSIIGFCLAVWFIRAFRTFPEQINRGCYEDYHSLIPPMLSWFDFQQQSALQPKKSIIINSLYIVLPVMFGIYGNASWALLGVSAILLYLAFLDYYYYLTDIRYTLMIFCLVLWQVLFNESQWLDQRIFSLWICLQFFLIFSPLATWLFKKEVIGSGDICLFAALSPLFDLSQLLWLMLGASLAGIIFYSGYWLRYRQKLTRLPFIPFIAFSTFLLFIDRI